MTKKTTSDGRPTNEYWGEAGFPPNDPPTRKDYNGSGMDPDDLDQAIADAHTCATCGEQIYSQPLDAAGLCAHCHAEAGRTCARCGEHLGDEARAEIANPMAHIAGPASLIIHANCFIPSADSIA